MRSLIYDIITGAAIILALIVIVEVLRANQGYIVSSSETKTDVEQLYVEWDDNLIANRTNTYTVADVYSTFRSLIDDENNIHEYTNFKLILNHTYELKYVDRGKSTHKAAVNTIDTALKNYMNDEDNINKEFKCVKTFETDKTPKRISYEFSLVGS